MEYQFLTERRKHSRYIVKDNILLFNGSIFAEIVNISLGGVFCRFLTDVHEQLNPIHSIDLINAPDKIFVKNISCHDLNWADHDTRQLFNSTALRNCRLQFAQVDREKKNQLLQFMDSVVAAKQPISQTPKSSASS